MAPPLTVTLQVIRNSHDKSQYVEVTPEDAVRLLEASGARGHLASLSHSIDVLRRSTDAMIIELGARLRVLEAATCKPGVQVAPPEQRLDPAAWAKSSAAAGAVPVALDQPGAAPSVVGCEINMISSRICQRGQMGCNIDHAAQPGAGDGAVQWPTCEACGFPLGSNACPVCLASPCCDAWRSSGDELARLRAEIQSLSDLHVQSREARATHRCKVCEAKWIRVPDAWTLASKTCGECCDNAVMGDQIEAIGLTAELEQARRLYEKMTQQAANNADERDAAIACAEKAERERDDYHKKACDLADHRDRLQERLVGAITLLRQVLTEVETLENGVTGDTEKRIRALLG